jgi:hypothetical protein
LTVRPGVVENASAAQTFALDARLVFGYPI